MMHKQSLEPDITLQLVTVHLSDSLIIKPVYPQVFLLGFSAPPRLWFYAYVSLHKHNNIHFLWKLVLRCRKYSFHVDNSFALKCVTVGLIYVFKRHQSHTGNAVEILVHDLMCPTTLFCQAEENSLLQSHIKITSTSLANTELAT